MSSNEVGYIEGLTVKKHSEKKRKQDIISGPCARREYMPYFNTVENNDHYISLYLTTIWTIRYYLRIFCWTLGRFVHTLFVLVCYLAKLVIGNSEWNNYLNRNNG